jgi:radical SAM protein with 4Fe4S-binding SPASM domain
MIFNTEVIKGHYLVSSPQIGAVSLFSPAEYLAFKSVMDHPQEDRAKGLNHLLSGLGKSEEEISRFSSVFLRKLQQQGWCRDSIPDYEPEKLQMVYFSITTRCNLSCIYCYIGDENRQPDHIMSIEVARYILDKIKTENPRAEIAITGGEPLTHPHLFEILDHLASIGLSFKLGTNATLIDEPIAERLSSYKNMMFTQASIDGISPGIHSITRGDTFHAAMKGIQNLIRYKVPFAIAPTLHEGNVHEMESLARFTFENGGTFSPNHLRKFPHAPFCQKIKLEPSTLRNTILKVFTNDTNETKKSGINNGAPHLKPVNLSAIRCKTVCGNAWSTLDIDWNGDVYPCHLLREKEFKLGNILEEEFNVIFERGKKSSSRVKSTEIPKCKTCAFVATCAGGCRSSAWYNQGTFAAEEEYCEILYKFEIDKLFYLKGIPFHAD